VQCAASGPEWCVGVGLSIKEDYTFDMRKLVSAAIADELAEVLARTAEAIVACVDECDVVEAQTESVCLFVELAANKSELVGLLGLVDGGWDAESCIGVYFF
jgi:hypothetical protein